MSRTLRSLVCLLLICCILVNLSPLKAKAVTPGMVAVGTVSALVLIPAILYGLGVMQSSTDTGSAAFNQLVSDCYDHLSNLGWIAAGAATMLSLTQDGSVITYAHRNMIQDIFDWLYDSTIVVDPQFLNSSSYYNPLGSYIELTSASPIYTQYVKIYWLSGGYSACSFSLSSSLFYLPSGKQVGTLLDNGLYYYVTCQAGSTASGDQINHSLPYVIVEQPYKNYDLSTYIASVSSGPFQVSTPLDFSLGEVATQDTEIETGYETYIQEGIVSIDFGIQFEDGSPYDPDGDDQKYHHWFPVKVPSPDNLSNLTQEDAWSGESEVELEYKADTDTGTDSGNGSGNTGTDSGSTGNTGSSWKPPSDHSQFALADLSKFFPFCIPFDLFDFFKLLNADPVAPSFTWEIQDLSGQTYGLTVDLSQWDSVAQLFRRLQLFLFVCGLAAASRKYIKW